MLSMKMAKRKRKRAASGVRDLVSGERGLGRASKRAGRKEVKARRRGGGPHALEDSQSRASGQRGREGIHARDEGKNHEL